MRLRPPTAWIKSAADYSENHGGQTMVVLFDGKHRLRAVR